jgi:type III pantothenate kinase
MDLVIDLGNTYAKTGLFDANHLVETNWRLSYEALQAYAKTLRIGRIMVSSVGRAEADIRRDFADFAEDLLVLTPQTPVPLTKHYDTPQTLGADRVAAAVGAKVRFPTDDCLVIDMGTCITYDMVDASDCFLGGLISPGLRMRFEAMHTFTKRLPLIAPAEVPALIGKNTSHAMLSGVMNGLLAEISGIIGQYQELFPDCQVILCGGDAHFFESRLKTPIFALPEIVLIGLHRILEHNAH